MTTDVQTREPEWTTPNVALRIVSHDEYVQLAGMLSEVKAFERHVEVWFGPLVQRAHAAWKGLTERKRETLAPAKEWENRVKVALAAWDTEQERIRQEELRRLEALARKREEERRLAEAVALEAEGIAEADEGKIAEAEQMIEEPVETPVVTVAKATPKVEGISYREQWNVEVVDLFALIRHVAQHPEFTNLLQPNMTALNAQARSLKDHFRIPGIKAFAKKLVAAR